MSAGESFVAIFKFHGEMTPKMSKHSGDDPAPVENPPNGVRFEELNG